MTVGERINAERFVLAGWSRAILLQLAHPLVAAGVAEHSTFRGGLLSAAVRLHHTVAAMRRLTFGTTDEARATLDHILAIHRRVNGRLRDGVGPFTAGTPYSAEDPSLVTWVHATLLDSLPLVYGAVIKPLTDDERDEWCRESAPVARALGASDDLPESWAALQAYIAQMQASGAIIVGNTARALARDVLAPRLSTLIAPARALNRTVTVGLLPERIRAQYGMAWQPGDEHRLARALSTLRTLRRLTPDRLAIWPDARH
ncbi:MAG TPA: oxygenase MpaB family protein [Luteitalea sp.]|nr:oxygenase MpaB family protein [Luteitalea sp.]